MSKSYDEYIKRCADTAPPPTPDRMQRLALLLHPFARGSGDANPPTPTQPESGRNQL